MVITRSQRQNLPELPLNFHMPERRPRQPRQYPQPQPQPQPQPPVFQFNAVNAPQPAPQARPQRGRRRVVRAHEQEDVLFFADRPAVYDNEPRVPIRNANTLVSEARDWIQLARQHTRNGETELRHIENYKLNSPFTIFHEYVDNLNHLMNRIGSITTDANVLYAFASTILRPYFRGVYNWEHRQNMEDNLNNFDMAILGTLTNERLPIDNFNHYLSVFRWKDPENENRFSLLYYDPEHNCSVNPRLFQFHHYGEQLQQEGYTRVQMRGSYNKDDQANTEFNCGARCIAFLLTLLHHSDKTFEHIRVHPRQ